MRVKTYFRHQYQSIGLGYENIAQFNQYIEQAKGTFVLLGSEAVKHQYVHQSELDTLPYITLKLNAFFQRNLSQITLKLNTLGALSHSNST